MKMTTAPEAPTDNHSVALNEAIKAIKAGADNRLGHIKEYLNVLSSGMEGLRIGQYTGEFDDAVVASIESFIPHLAQFTELLSAIVQYEAEENYADVLHKFFEKLIPYLHYPKGYSGWIDDTAFDNSKFIIHELFLSTIAILLREEKFDTVRYLVSNEYYVEPYITQGKTQSLPYFAFWQYVGSINQTRSGRLKINTNSLQTDILKDRTQYSKIDFQHILQADFILFMRAELVLPDSSRPAWCPVTFLYATDTFRIFAKAESIKYFNRIKPLLGIDKKDDMLLLFDAYANRKKQLPSGDFSSLNPKLLMDFDKLATKP